MAQIPKALREITRADLQAVCDAAWLEDEQLDFKLTIPHKARPEEDPWKVRQSIGDHGRDQLLATVVAFANSYGGDLIVGIEETTGNPGAARALALLPNCADAADRLSKQANACIEPHLSSLEVRGIPIDADGNGVVIFRVSQSRNAPHRLTTTKDCYHRVRHETLPMTMRQIQDLTFSSSRGIAAIEERFASLRAGFLEWSKVRAPLQGNKRAAFRVSCVPLSSCYVEKVHNVPALTPAMEDLNGLLAGKHRASLHTPIRADHWRPQVRATVGAGERSSGRSRVQLHCDGVVTFESTQQVAETDDTREQMKRGVRVHNLYVGWLFGTIGHAMQTADKFRNAAGLNSLEYAMEVEIATSHPLPVIALGDTVWIDTAGTIEPNQPPLPRYVLGQRDTWPQVSSLVWRDFWNSAGVATDDSFEFQW
jgi:hypothetical protein